MANIVNLDRVGKGYGGVGPLLTEVSAGIGQHGDEPLPDFSGQLLQFLKR